MKKTALIMEFSRKIFTVRPVIKKEPCIFHLLEGFSISDPSGELFATNPGNKYYWKPQRPLVTVCSNSLSNQNHKLRCLAWPVPGEYEIENTWLAKEGREVNDKKEDFLPWTLAFHVCVFNRPTTSCAGVYERSGKTLRRGQYYWHYCLQIVLLD